MVLEKRFNRTWGLSGCCRSGEEGLSLILEEGGVGLRALWTSVKVNPGRGWVSVSEIILQMGPAGTSSALMRLRAAAQ